MGTPYFKFKTQNSGWRYFLLLFLLTDLLYTFYLHFHLPLDGDLAGLVLPSDWYRPVLADPFGWRVLTEGASYAGAGRSFIHWFVYGYFNSVPFWLQSFLAPLDSVYAAAALLRTGLQAGLIGLLAAYVSGTLRLGRTDFLLAAALFTPFFQTFGYYVVMGTVDQSVTYASFYALPMLLLGLFFYPFCRAARAGRQVRLSLVQKILLALLAVAVAFSGPLTAPVVLLVCPAVLGWRWWRHFREERALTGALRRMDPVLSGYFILLILLCSYTFYLGTFNVENAAFEASLWDRYRRLGVGLYKQLTQRLGWPLLLLLVAGNAWWLRRAPGKEAVARERKWLLWIGLFSAAYLLLLPLGGFREYRPWIVRRDTMLPVTLGMIFFIGRSAYYLLRHLPGKVRYGYAAALIASLLLFTLVDTPDFRAYRCERSALEEIVRAPAPVVRLDRDCTILSWVKVRDPGDSAMNVRLLYRWGVVADPEKRYVQE